MQFSPTLLQRPTLATRPVSAHSQKKVSSFSSHPPSQHADGEIQAFIAARDMAIADAQRNPTNTSLTRAFLANELVENCLKPARTPYQAQSFPEAEAMREKKRCESVTGKLAQLRACIATAA